MIQKKRMIEVVEYDPRWPDKFEKERSVIVDALGDQVVQVHHIGSTAVPGLRAKPVIDILLEVKDVEALDAYAAEMVNLGYVPKGEFGIPGRRFYLKGLYDRTHHIHAFNAGVPDVWRHLTFRDYLIAHPSIAKEYEELKLKCADECDNDSDKYGYGKESFIRSHDMKALEWIRCQQPAQCNAVTRSL